MRETDAARFLELLTEIYGQRTAKLYHSRLSGLVEKFQLPTKRAETQSPDIILISYPDHLSDGDQTPLQALTGFCDNHFTGLVDGIHLLPFYPSTSDDGFAVSDFRSVNPAFGGWDDILQLSQNFGLMFDGVFNHVSASHPWFKSFLADDPHYRDYFIALDKETDVTMVTRPRTSPLLIAFDTAAGQKYVWATFSADQLDLNYANPEVLLEIISVILEYVHRGASLIRLDAIGYLWKQPGTTSIHLPRTHAIIRLIRSVLDHTAPSVKLVTETNVPHNENITYFGNGHDEAQMVYNFALPPLLVHTMQTGDASVLSAWAATLRTASDKTAYFNFTASHDGIGLLGARKFLSAEQMEDMCRRVEERGGRLSMRTLASGQNSVYEMNISYFDAVTDPAASPEKAVDQFICSQAIALSLAGVAGIYLPGLWGSKNWTAGVELQGHNRAINRQKFDRPEIERQLAQADSPQRLVFERYIRLLKIRAAEPAFAATGTQSVRQSYGPSIFAVERRASDGTSVLALHNVTSEQVKVPLESSAQDLLSGQDYSQNIKLQPYQVAWLKLSGSFAAAAKH